MRLSRRRAIAALSSLSLSITGTARAESYPSKPVRVIVPTGPGGITDLIARIMCQRLTERLGQSFVINNRTGAGGIIGTDLVAHAAPDGYTLLMAYPSHVVNQSLKLHLPYDTIRDFTGITALTSVSLVLLVTPSLAANSVAELIALAKRQRITFASVGAGSLGYLGAELFCMRAGIEMVHVPYRSTPDAQSALMSGDVSVYFDTPITAVPQCPSAGRLRALGVSTLKRAALLPGGADHRRSRPSGLRSAGLERHPGAERNAACDHTEAEPGAMRDPRRTGSQKEARGSGCRSDAVGAGCLCEIDSR